MGLAHTRLLKETREHQGHSNGQFFVHTGSSILILELRNYNENQRASLRFQS